jgi:serine/threonine-protein kinase
MAEVWLARAIGLAGFEKLVVLKTILPALAENPQFTDMFINEARLAAMLNHPNCVQIFDLGREGDTLFIAMEYIDGFSLSRILRRCETTSTPVPIKLICRIVMDALAGLEYAHHLTNREGRAMELVHRDISPDNLLVSFTGQTKVVDFGIAKAASEPGRPGGTRTGTVKGKFGYMAPEHLRGEAVDGRADVFAMGVLLYRALTGKKPFSGATDAMTTMAVLTQVPPAPSTINKLLPRSMDDVIYAALEKTPAHRFESAKAMRSAIEKALTNVSDTEAVGNWLQQLWPKGDSERVALQSLASSSGTTEESSEPVLESVVSEDVDLAFTQSGVTVRTSDGAVSVSKATPYPVDDDGEPRRSRAPLFVAIAVAVVVCAAITVPLLRRSPPATPVAPHPAAQAPPTEHPAPIARAEPEPAARPETAGPPEAANEAPEAADAPEPKTPAKESGGKAAPGWLEITSTPAVAITVKGRPLGRTPVKASLPPGKYTVRATDPSAGIDKSLSVVIRPGGTSTSALTFAKGRLDLRVSPWAAVKLDGRSLGNTPIPVQELYEGTHHLELSNPELGNTKRLDVVIGGGETKVVRESLE